MCSTFLVANFVWRAYGTPWLEMSAKGSLGQLALGASRALAQSNFGTAHHYEDGKLYGMIQYSNVLQELAPLLSDPSRPGVEELIVPVMLLLIHTSSQADRHGSISHVKGLVQLLYVCGPQRFQREPLRHAFESCRSTLVTMGLIARQRSFLEEAHWRTVPWALDPAAQSAQSLLVNILVFVPGFLEDDSRLDQESDFALREDLVQRLNIHLEELFEWRWRWEARNPNIAWEEESGRESSRGRRIRFATLSQAIEIMTYDSVLLWILGLLWKIDPSNTHSAVLNAARHAHGVSSCGYTAPSPLHLPGEAVQLRDVAIEICRAFDFQIRNIEKNAASSLFFLMPIGLAWSVLEHEEEWNKAISHGLARSYVTRGYQTGHNVFGFGRYAVPKLPFFESGSKPATLWLSHSSQSAWLVGTAEQDEINQMNRLPNPE
ncbi:hypothetical protein MMC17_002268 [Xylographa soralifera]|nr:hypothetical protein [Xylographa soralifera]